MTISCFVSVTERGVILPADKGRATVILDRTDYTQKMNDILREGNYQLIKKDPTLKLERSLVTNLKILEVKLMASFGRELLLSTVAHHSYMHYPKSINKASLYVPLFLLLDHLHTNSSRNLLVFYLHYGDI